MAKFRLLSFAVIVIVAVSVYSAEVCANDTFTATAQLAPLVEVERTLAGSLRAYIDQTSTFLANLRRTAQQLKQERASLDTAAAEHGDHEGQLSALLTGQKTLARLAAAWTHVKRMFAAAGRRSHHDLQRLMKKHTKTHLTAVDMRGSSEALLRLRSLYNLPISKLAEGTVLHSQGLPLSVEDLYHTGMMAFQDDHFDESKVWLEEVLRQLRSGVRSSNINQLTLLHLVASAEIEMRNISRALELGRQIIRLGRNSARARDYVRRLQKRMDSLNRDTLPWAARRKGNERAKETVDEQEELEEGEDDDDDANDDDEDNIPMKKEYERLCRGAIPAPDHLQHRLKCFLTNMRRNPRLVLRPAKVEVLSIDPTIVVFREMISDEEVGRLKELAFPALQLATSVTESELPTEYSASSYRISKSAWLYEHEDVSGVVRRCNQRIADYTGLSMETAEVLQVANYGIGGHFEPHFDHDDEGTDVFRELGTGNRIATLLFYLSDVTAGGATVFPHSAVRLVPSKGDASFWYNLHPSGAGDGRSLHAGCPVLVGSKWVSNKWIHEKGQEFLKPCGKHPDDKWNIHAPPEFL